MTANKKKSRKIKDSKELDKLTTKLCRILDIKTSTLQWYLVDTEGEQTEDFSMPNGVALIGDKESIIAFDYAQWKKVADATNEIKKRKAYAKIAGVLAHELMHIYQCKHSYKKYNKEFLYEAKLPKNTDKWSTSQRRKYDNLRVELEALAFGFLVESTILQSRRISTLPTYTNRYQFKKVYSKIKSQHKKKIEEAFYNLPYYKSYLSKR